MANKFTQTIRNHWRDYLLLFGIAAVIVVLDQITKVVVRNNLTFGEIWVPWHWLAPYARIVNIQNSGAAFGSFQNLGDVFAILAVIVAGAIVYYFPQVPREDKLLRIALALQFSGAIGNLIDRIHQGWVTDFVSLGPFPVFNVADLCITTGVILLILSIWLKERNKPAVSSQTSETSSETGVDPCPKEPMGE
jgi:signal peptidase II